MAKKGHFLLGFVFGAASALATTYLLTPQTSDELKRRVKHASENLADRAVDYFDYAKEARRAVTMLTGHKPWLIMMLQPNNYAIS